MITLNNKLVKITRFPDNTFKFDLPEDAITKDSNYIVWKFESMEELFTLMGVKQKLDEFQLTCRLVLPYLPNARMDKICNPNEGLMLKYLITSLDNLGFEQIELLDPHSPAYKQWIKNTVWFENNALLVSIIDHVITCCMININENPEDPNEVTMENLTLVFPDKGAKGRYSKLLDIDHQNIVYGQKVRNQETGEILSFDLVGDIENEVVLIIDDICSKGGTFYHTANKIREKGFKGEIFLYVTHCENSIFEGEILKDNSEISRVYTTSSIMDKSSCMHNLEVLEISYDK